MSPLGRIAAVLPAAGVGRRMGAALPKQYLDLLGRPVIAWTLDALLGHPLVEGAVVAVGSDDHWWESVPLPRGKWVDVVPGGAERQDSVLNALDHLLTRPEPPEWVLVHDAVRPCVTGAELDALLDAIRHSPDGALLALPVRDTLKRSDATGASMETMTRDAVWQALTPQCFPLRLLHEALSVAQREGVRVTDEAQAMERRGYRPMLVEGRLQNLKLTHPADLALIAAILDSQHNGS